MDGLPYSEIFFELLINVHKALGYCFNKYCNGEIISENDVNLNKLFVNVEKKYRQSGINKHIIKGLTKSEQNKFGIYPRITKLIIRSFNDAIDTKEKSANYKGYLLPSPLSIIYHALTIPSEPQTAAYAFVLCRSMLFNFLNLHPAHPDLSLIDPNLNEFSETHVLKSVSSFNNYIQIQARWPDPRSKKSSFATRINFLNGHILSTKGISNLWFNSREALSKFCNNIRKNLHVIRTYYCDPQSYQFRLSGQYTDLPDSTEIINWIFGLPIPIRGADILFYGALKKSASTGLVLSLHGEPGAGKTSIALSLAACLSPFKTTTFYISLEEEELDLQNRLITLIPSFLRELSIFPNAGSKEISSEREN